MKSIAGVGLKEVKDVYSGPEGDLWELVMGEQIHIGGFASSMALADKAGKLCGLTGVDLCCCTGAGMRFLVRFQNVTAMTGVDATQKVIRRGEQRCQEEGLAGKIGFVESNVCNTGLADKSFDFVWGEDAWCYVEDKARLITEAVRILKPGGTIAFTDWVEGHVGLSSIEAQRLLNFMKFPNLLTIGEYRGLLEKNGCQVVTAENTKQFAPHVDLYLNMLTRQLTYDALKIVGFDSKVMQALASEMVFMQKLAHEGKIIQGRFVARKK